MQASLRHVFRRPLGHLKCDLFRSKFAPSVYAAPLSNSGINACPSHYFSTSAERRKQASGSQQSGNPPQTTPLAKDTEVPLAEKYNTTEKEISSDESLSESNDQEIDDLQKANDALSSQLSILQTSYKEVQDKLLRSLAENENSRQRYLNEVENAKQYGISKFAESILEVADNLERAVTSSTSEQIDSTTLLEGIKLTQVILNNTLSNYKITAFESIGKPFDPKYHEALFEFNTDEYPKGHVAQVVKEGYMIKNRVLRPAKVGTSKGPNKS